MNKPTKGIVVDGWCSGNPGPGGYRGIDIETSKELFRHKFGFTTNNIMEFCASVHGLRYLKENKLEYEVYTDSVSALAWVKNKSVNTTFRETTETKIMFEFIRNCELYLLNTFKNNIPLNKWYTDLWGENPADLGNKNTILKVDLQLYIEELKKDNLSCLYTINKFKEKFGL